MHAKLVYAITRVCQKKKTKNYLLYATIGGAHSQTCKTVLNNVNIISLYDKRIILYDWY